MFESTFWLQFHFMRPAVLLLLLPFALLSYLRWRATKQSQQSYTSFPKHLLEALLVGRNNWIELMPLKLLLLVIVFCIVTAAGPTWLKKTSPFAEDQGALVVLLDVSESMLEKDITPNRLQRAKYKIEDILANRNGGSTALIVFAGSAHIAMPLTHDSKVFKPLLEASSPKIMPVKGKFAEKSLPLVDKLLADKPGSVMLVTDGLGSDTTEQFSAYFLQSKHQLLTLAVGDQSQASSIELELEALEALPGETILISIDDTDIQTIDRLIERHMQLSLDQALPWKDMGYPLVFAIAALSLLWFRRGWLVQWGLVICLLMTTTSNTVQANDWQFIDLWMTSDQQGQWQYNQQQYAEAAMLYQDTMHKATAYYAAQDYKNAFNYFMRIDSEQARFNAANSLAHQREYVAARDMFQDIVKRNPDNQDANHNFAVLQKLIEDINQHSQSQANTERESSRELGDAPKTSEGSEEKVDQEQLLEASLSAEQILNDSQVNDKWMRRVQTDPANFLRTKFAYQYSRSNTPEPEPKP